MLGKPLPLNPQKQNFKYYLCYNHLMKKETIKEFGKLLYDFAKIGLAITIITPLAKGDSVSFGAILVVLIVVFIATYIINKGAK